VIRGNTLVIPIDNSLLYVEPIYFQAEAAAYPEFRLVAVMYGDNLSYADTFEKALRVIDPRREATVADVSANARGRKDDLKRADPPGKTGIRELFTPAGRGEIS
jgi:uncharacterized membrane protein (UPF0182 family)